MSKFRTIACVAFSLVALSANSKAFAYGSSMDRIEFDPARIGFTANPFAAAPLPAMKANGNLHFEPQLGNDGATGAKVSSEKSSIYKEEIQAGGQPASPAPDAPRPGADGSYPAPVAPASSTCICS
jgi:hypothetical protein